MPLSNVSLFSHVYCSQIRHFSLRPRMMVSNGFSNRHVGLLWSMSVLDGSQMKHVEVSDGSQIRPVGLRWVSNGSPIGL